VRAQRGRKKKLIVAFHFYREGNQTAWRCDECRKAGLEKRRNCGYLRKGGAGKSRPVWASGKVWTAECPRSFITAESLTLLDAYAVWRMPGALHVFEDMPARVADALMTLHTEERAELNHGDRKD